MKFGIANGEAIFYLVRGARYQLDLTYKYPAQIINLNSRATVLCKSGESLVGLGPKTLNVDSVTNSILYSFTTKRYLEDFHDTISYEFSTETDNATAISTDSKILFQIGESKMFWLQIATALILFSGVSLYIGADLTEIQPLTLSAAFDALWAKGLAGLGQAGILFWLFRLIGKKVL